MTGQDGGQQSTCFRLTEHLVVSTKGLRIYARNQQLIFRGKSSAYKSFLDVEDEEGAMTLLAIAKLISSPSILSTANQGYGG